jgi:integrase/transcriptional regulator with XRE-family HTH domain
MDERQSKAPISDLLRQAIIESGVSYNALQRETGVTRASIMRFVRGSQSLRLDMADRLAEHFGLELRKRTRPLPLGAEYITRKGVRLARWRDGKGKIRTAPVTTGRDGTERIREESSTYFARHRDGNGIVVETPTGCRDESAARQVLADLERRAERVRSGLLTSAEDSIAEHQTTPIGEHVDGFAASLEASGATAKHVRETRRILGRIFNGCDFHILADLERSAVEHWLNTRRSEGASARTRNVDLAALIAFGNWCVANRRLMLNPFRGIPKANEAADPRRRRRAMTEDELVRLLEVARRRPLLDALTVHTGKRKGEAFANIRPEVRERLEALGRERALIYKMLVLTGLRKNELATLAVAQLRLDGPVPHVELDAADEKNREGNGVVIRADLAGDLKLWLADKLAMLQAEARRRAAPIPAGLPSDTPIFDVPAGLVRIFDRDLKHAGIPKRDERGRTLDVHALRTTFGTLLSRGGVPLRTAQAAMRHSDPSLTANVYTDPKLLDVHGALDALPRLPLDSEQSSMPERARATGTGTYGRSSVALPPDKGGQSAANAVKMAVESPNSIEPARPVVSAESISGNATLAIADRGREEWRRPGSNRQPPACKAGALPIELRPRRVIPAVVFTLDGE